jgi:hypothetical protein
MWPWTLWKITEQEAGAALWVGLLAAIIAIWGVISQRAITRRQVTMEHIAKAEADRDLIGARERFISLTQTNGALVALADLAPLAERKEVTEEVTEEVQANLGAVRLLFNHLELTAIGIQMGIIDYALFKRFAKSAVLRDWERGAPLIYALRKKYNQDSMYHEFEELARWLRDNNMPRRRRWFSLWR